MNTQAPPPRLSESVRDTPPVGSDDGDIINLFDLLRSIWRRKWIIVGSAIFLGMLVAIVVSFVTPRYSAIARIMLNPRETRVVTSQEVVSDLDLSNPVIESEVALIRSSVLLESTVREIGVENLMEFDPRRMSEQGWTVRLNRAIERVTMLLEGEEGATKVATPLPDDSQVEQADPDVRPVGPTDNLYRRIVGQMRGYLTIEQLGNSYVISISASAEDPQVAALLVNTIAERYIATQLEERIEGTRRATRWLQTRVADLREQVATAEAAIEARRAEKLTADGGGVETASQQLGAMSVQLSAARADYAEAQARYDQIRQLVETEGFTAAADVLSSTLVLNLRENHAALLRHQADLASRYGPEHPDRMRVAAEIARAEEGLAAEIGNLIKGLAREVEVAGIRQRSVAADVLALEERVSSISGTSTDLRDLEREAKALSTVYENMLSRLKETRAHEALAQAEAKVIEYALPPGAPSYPRSKLLISAAVVAGAGLGLGLVLVMELSSNTFHSTPEVLRETRLPVLAALPRSRRRDGPDALRGLIAADDGVYGERIRQLRTALIFGVGEPPRSVNITSSLPGEGKTDTTLALAHMNALMGRRVIVVDCDFRRAALCKAFGWRPAKDFAAVLRDEASLDDAILSEATVGFDVLPVAKPVANVTDMLHPARFRAIVDKLSERYDLVLVDAPSVLHTADALVVARSAETLIYLVKWDSTPKKVVRQGLGALAEFGIAPQGIVLTQVNRRRIGEFHQASDPVAGRSEARA
ncbi:polysaccharide biosynthesis tyrosine autokinase [Paracoccus sp. MBLB3053]|uniref:non-specific protein-tyrosine kinase n=1 Tax=Paracoccus aurantius TaxID=3073814 RepID=A0ABU2HV49_9RHOB|nr:polysaccharide biosynthesis tyrosine autokinase [Paracoccus sp. MBLB3053]MDS9468933.1 polysaccharide biosynthesis tyrosine autokinase [Paracoccus sp. MBLB3053]